MPFSKSKCFFPILRVLRLAAVTIVSVTLAVLALNWCCQFHPPNRTEAVGPAGDSHRAFTEISGFRDISVHLYAADWPWTFAKPAMLGDLYWPEIQKYVAVYWSMDGSVIAFQRQHNEDAVPMFRAAYDYRNHELIQTDYRLGGPSACDIRIAALLKERGGIGLPETGLDDFKRDFGPHMFPAWGLRL